MNLFGRLSELRHCAPPPFEASPLFGHHIKFYSHEILTISNLLPFVFRLIDSLIMIKSHISTEHEILIYQM